MNMLFKIVNAPFVLLIKVYQWTLSPILGASCRFRPSCSNYALQAFRKYDPFNALWLTARRLARCHPWGGHGDDPLP